MPVKTRAISSETALGPQSTGSPRISRTENSSLPAQQNECQHDAHELTTAAPKENPSPDPFNLLLALRHFRRLLNAEEVGNLLGKSKFTIYRMVRLQQIPYRLVLGSLRFDPSVLELWLIKKQPMLAVAARQLTAAQGTAQSYFPRRTAATIDFSIVLRSPTGGSDRRYFSVVARFLWPKRTWRDLTSTPERSALVAKVCRHLCRIQCAQWGPCEHLPFRAVHCRQLSLARQAISLQSSRWCASGFSPP